MIDTPRILKTTEQPTAVMHITVAREEIQRVMGPGLNELLATLRARGTSPSGAWFTHHLKMPGKVFDFNIGVPVGSPVTPSGRVVPGVLPAVTVARTIYRGGFEGLPAAWPGFEAWIVAQGRKPASWLWETYLKGPESGPNPSTWETELTRPLIE